MTLEFQSRERSVERYEVPPGCHCMAVPYLAREHTQGVITKWQVEVAWLGDFTVLPARNALQCRSNATAPSALHRATLWLHDKAPTRILVSGTGAHNTFWKTQA